jgi:hypothetical protein
MAWKTPSGDAAWILASTALQSVLAALFAALALQAELRWKRKLSATTSPTAFLRAGTVVFFL